MGWFDSIKLIGETIKKVNDAKLRAELNEKILDLQADCAELLAKNADLRETIESLREECDSLRKNADLRKHMKYVGNAYLLDDHMGQRGICPACFEKYGITVPLCESDMAMHGFCPSCNAGYDFPFPDLDRPKRIK